MLDPGPDVVICDEGHLLKNEKSAINKAVNRIKTHRRYNTSRKLEDKANIFIPELF